MHLLGQRVNKHGSQLMIEREPSGSFCAFNCDKPSGALTVFPLTFVHLTKLNDSHIRIFAYAEASLTPPPLAEKYPRKTLRRKTQTEGLDFGEACGVNAGAESARDSDGALGRRGLRRTTHRRTIGVFFDEIWREIPEAKNGDAQNDTPPLHRKRGKNIQNGERRVQEKL